MPRSATQKLCLALLMTAGQAVAGPPHEGSVWRRALPGGAQEMELRGALDRAALGYGDDRDLLRIRLALVESGRGRLPRDAGNVVLLVHFRIELSRMTPGGDSGLGPRLRTWLQEALLQPLAPELRALGYFELARLARADGLPGAEGYLSQALAEAVDDEQRAQLWFVRGLLHIDRARSEPLAASEVSSDFEQASELATGTRLRAACLLGAALSSRRLGALAQADLLAKSAAVLWQQVASASGLSLGVALSMLPSEEALFAAELERGRALQAADVTLKE